MKKLMILFAFFTLGAGGASAQKFAIKNNLLADATTSLNLGAEYGFAKHFSAELYVSWNPFIHSGHKQFRHIMLQPEFRYWTCERFNGIFFGAHLLGAQYNMGGISLPGYPHMKNYRYDGTLYGAGVTLGYQWILSKRWNIEAALGAGYIVIDYSQYDAPEGGDYAGEGKVKMLGPTKASLSFVFFFN